MKFEFFYLSYFGLAKEQRCKKIVQLIMDAQWDDGGWNCDPRLEASYSSFHESLATLNGLIPITKRLEMRRSRSAQRELQNSSSHTKFSSLIEPGKIVKEEWLKLRYPAYWHYNFPESMLVLCLAGKGTDSRTQDLLDLLERKCNPNGKWDGEGHYWALIDKGKPYGKIQTSKEVVDWGLRGTNEMITLYVLRVLRAAGRIS